MNKTELVNKVKTVNKYVKNMELWYDVAKVKDDLKSLESNILNLFPNSKVEVDIIEKDNKIVDIGLLVSIDDFYRGRYIDKDIESKRCNFAKLDNLHKGIEVLVSISECEYSISASICVDYTLKNGYKEIYDIISIIDKSYIMLAT